MINPTNMRSTLELIKTVEKFNSFENGFAKIKLCIDSGADIYWNNECAFKLAIKSGNLELVQTFIEYGVGLDPIKSEKREFGGYNKVDFAVQHDQLDIAQYFCQTCKLGKWPLAQKYSCCGSTKNFASFAR